jgi:hypothetical protein
VCRELVPVEVAVEEAFSDRVNFVMLNVENPKWGPELAEYRVGGIPHFVFLDGSGQPLAAAVGKLPATVLQGEQVETWRGVGFEGGPPHSSTAESRLHLRQHCPDCNMHSHSPGGYLLLFTSYPGEAAIC